ETPNRPRPRKTERPARPTGAVPAIQSTRRWNVRRSAYRRSTTPPHPPGSMGPEVAAPRPREGSSPRLLPPDRPDRPQLAGTLLLRHQVKVSPPTLRWG